MSKNLHFSQNSPKISILVTVVVWSSFQSKSSKNVDMSQNFLKISILFKSLKIIENLNKSTFSKFSNISISVKIFEKSWFW